MLFKSTLLAASLMPALAFAQGFTCSSGQPACIGYGEKICSSSGKCVSDDTICFSQYQCNSEGFACQSDVTECSERFDILRDKYHALVDVYNELLLDSRQDAQEAADAIDDMRARRDREQKRDQELWLDLKDCVYDATTLIEAQYCMQ